MTKAAPVLTCLAAGAILFFSCTAYQPEGKRYQVEKAFFDAEKAVENFRVKPELRGAQDYLSLVGEYEKVFSLFQTLFPNLAGKDSLTQTEKEAAILAGQALIKAADLLMQGDKSDSAAALLQVVESSRYMAPRHHNEALLLLGRVADRQGNWIDAEGFYLKLLEAYYPPAIGGNYPALDVMELPRVIIEHYASIADEETARQKADWAIKYYQGIVDGFPRSAMTLAATRLLAESFNFKGEYGRSAALLQTVVDSTGAVVDVAKGMIADLYFTRLDRKDEALRTYQELISTGTDSVVIANTYLKLATIQIQNKSYEEGREYLRRLVAGFPRSRDMLIRAQVMKAQSFEEQQEYDRAKQEYLTLINEYPNTPQAIEVLIYFPDFYKKINQPVLAQQWVSKAEERLKEIIRDSPDRRLSLMAASYLGTFYVRNQMFDQAISQFLNLREQFPKSAQAADALLKIALIYQLNKKDLPKALDTYRQFVKQYPNSVVTPRIEEEIKRLEKG